MDTTTPAVVDTPENLRIMRRAVREEHEHPLHGGRPDAQAAIVDYLNRDGTDGEVEELYQLCNEAQKLEGLEY